jgi:hypothetical protein
VAQPLPCCIESVSMGKVMEPLHSGRVAVQRGCCGEGLKPRQCMRSSSAEGSWCQFVMHAPQQFQGSKAGRQAGTQISNCLVNSPP